MINCNFILSGLSRVSAFFKSLSLVRFVVLFASITLLLSTILSIIISVITDQLNNTTILNPQDTIWEKFFLAVILAPFFETLIIQHLPFLIFKKILGAVFIILISALAFSLMHRYNASYMLVAFIIGMVYAYAYYLRLDGGYPLLTVTIIHALHNGIALIIETLS